MNRRLAQTIFLGAVVLGCGSDVTSPGSSAKPSPTVGLTTGAQFSCALTLEAKAYCWGDNLSGQLGDSSFVSKLIPTAVAGGHSFIALSSGVATTCGLEKSGTVWCWGDDPAQPGISLTFRNEPIAIPSDRPMAAITVGRKSVCALDSDGVAYCWGENGRGQLGVGDTLSRALPTRVSGDTRFTSISAGFWSTCGLSTDGQILCWGDNTYGELGTGDLLMSTTPKQIVGTSAFRFVTLGSIHACGITTAGAAMCWGANYSGQLGDGTGERRLAPVSAAAGLTFSALHAGRANSIFAHTCGVTTTGDVYCWGWNSKGQLSSDAVNTRDDCVSPQAAVGAVPKSECSYTPLKANGVSHVVALDAGQEHTCALTSSAVLLCWGENASGQLGDGTGVASLTPVIVKGGLHFP